MQTPSGGLGYWPGDDRPSDWGTAYATHMLLDARKAGYAVPEDRLAEILGYIENRLTQLEGAQGADPRSYYRHDEQAEIYLHYVLAVAGKGRKARMSKLLTSMAGVKNGQRAESEYMLQAALWLAGDRRHEDELERPDVSAITEDRSNGWSFYSDRRRRGFMLSTFVDLFGKQPQGEELAQRVAASLMGRPSGYYTTQELVWGVTGLGKWVAGGASDFEPGTLLAAGKPVEARPVRGKSNDRTWALARAGELSSLTLDVPRKGEGKLYLVISSDGVREKPEEKLGGNGLSVERRYRNLAGEEVELTAGNVKLGEVLYVEVEVGNTTGEPVQNVALVDRLPAGLEIENPRLGREGVADWIDEDSLWDMDYLDLRDDRVQVFGTLPPRSSRKVIYTVRAVTSGKFVAPPVEAEAMYDPSLWARHKGGTVVIAGPWEGLLI
jgi:uncharacterized repeat protein (TIGR01451 family)